MCKEIKVINASADVGEYLGFKLNVTFDSFNNKFVMNVKGAMSHPMEVSADTLGNITRINNALEAELSEKLDRLTALNAFLNMDEKGNDAIGMDEETQEGRQWIRQRGRRK